jgi:protein EARLY FLOWERING 3
MFQPFNAPSNVLVHSSKTINGNSVIQQISSTRTESGRPSSQANNNGFCAAGSAVECISQHRGENVTKKSSGKKLATDNGFMVPSIVAPRCPQHSTQEHAEVQEKLDTQYATSPQRGHPTVSKSSAKCCNAVNKHLERMNVSEMRSSSPKAREKEAAQALQTVPTQEMSSIEVSKQMFGSKVANVCLMRDKASNINNSGKAHLGNTARQAASMNGSSMKTQNRTTSKDTYSCNPHAGLDITNSNSYLPKESLKEYGTKRKRSPGNNDAKQNDDLVDSVESIHGLEISPDQIVNAIGQKHFWKARKAIQK